jgi:SNF2 family DNA or RNA helicase
MASDPISDDFEEDAEMSENTSSSASSKGKSPSVPPAVGQNGSEEDLLKDQLKGIEGDEDEEEDYPKESVFPEDAAGKLDDPIPWETSPRPNIPAFFHRKLRPHQDLALSKMEQAPNSSSILAMQMGLGKTSTALGFVCNKISRYYKEFKTIKGSQHLVVVPKGVVISWQDDFKKFISPASKIKMVVISEEAGPHAINDVLNGDAHIVVTTYYRMMDSFRSLYTAAGLSIFSKDAGLLKSQDQVDDCHMAVSSWNSSVSDKIKENFAFSLSADGMSGYARDKRNVINLNSKTPPKISWVYAVKWATLAFDESHKIRNSATRNYVAAFFVDAQSRVLISGTPIQNSYHDLYTALRLLRVPKFMTTGTWFAKGSYGLDHADYLDKMCKGYLIWIRKSDIPGLNMVTKRVFHRGIPFKSQLEEAYYNLWSLKAGKFAKEAAMKGKDKSVLKAARSEVMTAVLRCRQACNAVTTLKEPARKSEIQNPSAFPGIDDPEGWAGLHSTKLKALMEIVDEHIKDGPKFIILSGFVDMVDLIQEKLKRAGINAGKYTGSLTDAARSDVITKFKTDPGMRCLVLSLGAGSLGLSLELADRAIIIDPWWNPQVLKQAEDRIHRINSTKEVRITYLHISGTIEEAIMEVDQQKLEMENAIYEAVNIRALLKTKAANPVNNGGSGAQNGHNRMEVVVNKATRFWQENRKIDFCEECDFERREKRKRSAPDQIMKEGAEGLSPIEDDDEKMEDVGGFSASRFAASLKGRSISSKGQRASVKQTATGGVELPLIPLGGEHRQKQAKLDIKPVIPPAAASTSPPREQSPPASSELISSKIYRIIDTGVCKRAEVWEVFNAVSASLRSMTRIPPTLSHLISELVMEGQEIAKIRKDLEAIEKETKANHGMLAAAHEAMKQSEKCNSFPRSVIDQMRTSARETVCNLVRSKKNEIKKFKPVARAMFGRCDEFNHMSYFLHRLLPRIDIIPDLPSTFSLDLAFDAYLPLLALNPDISRPPAVQGGVIPDAGYAHPAIAHSQEARQLCAALRQAHFDLITCDAIVGGVDTAEYAPIPKLAPYLHMAYYSSRLSAMADSFVKVIHFAIGTPDIQVKPRVAALFIHYNKSTKSIQISDLVFINFGFDRDLIQRVVSFKFVLPKLKDVIQSLTVGKGAPPVHVICPRWMADRVKFIIKKELYAGKQWKIIRPDHVGEGPQKLNPVQRCIFAPWWVEFAMVSEKK